MIIVTGGAGFIGSALVWELNRKGIKDIVLVDRLHSKEKWKNLLGLIYTDFIHADQFPDKIQDHSWKDKIEAIFHLGACSSTTENDADFLMKNNFEYSKSMANLAQKLDVPFIYASSAATYGSGERGYSDDARVVDSLRPLNMYGYSKLIFDRWVLGQNPEKIPRRWYGLKFFNVYGPNEYHKGPMRSVVHQAFGQIKNSGRVKLFKSYLEACGHGEQLRDFVYVKDVARAMVEFFQKNASEEKNGLYNMGTGKARSFNDLARMAFRAMGKEENIEYIDMPEGLREQYQYFTQADMGKFKQLFPDFVFHDLEEGVEDYIQNYLQTENPYMDFMAQTK